MGYLHRSCIDEDVHDAGDAVEHVEEDAEQEACDKQGCCSCQVLKTPR